MRTMQSPTVRRNVSCCSSSWLNVEVEGCILPRHQKQAGESGPASLENVDNHIPERIPSTRCWTRAMDLKGVAGLGREVCTALVSTSSQPMSFKMRGTMLW